MIAFLTWTNNNNNDDDIKVCILRTTPSLKVVFKDRRKTRLNIYKKYKLLFINKTRPTTI